MKIFVLGHTGMLGHVVKRFLIQCDHEVLTTNERYAGELNDPFIEAVVSSEAEWVVNCAGVIPQRDNNQHRMMLVNGYMPIELRRAMGLDQKLIHISTDCVFDGKLQWHTPQDQPNSTTPYGFSKGLGEYVARLPQTWVLRGSIIGPEAGTNYNLMEWYLSQKLPIHGFTQHLWNGVTTLEMAKRILERIEGVPGRSIEHVTCYAPVTKYELLHSIRRAWGRGVDIRKAQGEVTLRTLTPTPNRIGDPIEGLLEEMKEWY